jgi:hypothetical protein
MVASVGVNVSFPLAFVAERLRPLPVIAAAALALQVALAWIGFELLELDGLAVALAISTLFVLTALLRELGALRTGLRGILRACGRDRRRRPRCLPPAVARPRDGGGCDRRRRALRRARRGVAPGGAHSLVGLSTGPALSAVR